MLFPADEKLRAALKPRTLPTLQLSEKKSAENKRFPVLVYLDQVIPKDVSVTREFMERNRSFAGGPLLLQGRPCERGLHARTPWTVTFPCKGYRRFKARAGVEWDGVAELSPDRQKFERIQVAVQADGKLLIEAQDRTYRSAPLEIDVDLGKAETLTLSASGSLPWLNPGFIWAEARLER